MFKRIAFLAVLGWMFAEAAVHGHHSIATVDLTKEVNMEGVVKEFQYAFPHAWLIVDVPDKSGKVTTWGFIAAGPPTLMKAGIRKGDLPPGTKVTVKANPMRDGSPAGMWLVVTRLSDGRVMEPRGVN